VFARILDSERDEVAIADDCLRKRQNV
jgi:hypothetical protein